MLNYNKHQLHSTFYIALCYPTYLFFRYFFKVPETIQVAQCDATATTTSPATTTSLASILGEWLFLYIIFL